MSQKHKRGGKERGGSSRRKNTSESLGGYEADHRTHGIGWEQVVCNGRIIPLVVRCISSKTRGKNSPRMKSSIYYKKGRRAGHAGVKRHRRDTKSHAG